MSKETKKEVFKHEPHNFSKKMLNYQYCVHCGLVTLKNKFTEWSIQQGCNYRDHPSYEHKRLQYTKLFD